ncbi:hypothetical protein SARC_04677 [Sphaeroforma arctica JP610]|uniref:Uncharacterized protein n=1 Tax=Sphaeroforma arctica JP610 TaxID=667725 RepID=A0A0L0G2L2_9EUKA|nr:hypothetical protein SARC_04677 [Sphaeroforma arctica JP610]KNC83059.1 hypothetical protein SARC_04677 [Sphaeroforma arctica JP610]|eukprot:XP_014156961.1 hypothetical protein SARC_04677 [Sphaeroforma arctica JP610]
MYRGTPHDVLDKQNVLHENSALDLFEGPVPGIHLDEPAFLSCTPDIAHAARFVHGSPCFILRFQIPSNVRYYYDKYTKNAREDECIIQRNTTLKNFVDYRVLKHLCDRVATLLDTEVLVPG